MELLSLFFGFSFVHLIRYLLFAGGAYYFFCVWGKEKFRSLRIQQREIEPIQVKREFWTSMVNVLIFGFVIGALAHPQVRPHLKIYNSFQDYPSWWAWLSIPFLTLVNDTYFYWMHRLVHHPKLYKWIHQTHHLSTNPSPWASYAFHPIEGFLEIIWIVPVVYFVPINKFLLMIYSVISLINSVRGHVNVEFVPLKYRNMFLLNWINTTTHHNHHHRHFKCNYGLYFLFWDRLCKTEKMTFTKQKSSRSSAIQILSLDHLPEKSGT